MKGSSADNSHLRLYVCPDMDVVSIHTEQLMVTASTQASIDDFIGNMEELPEGTNATLPDFIWSD